MLLGQYIPQTCTPPTGITVIYKTFQSLQAELDAVLTHRSHPGGISLAVGVQSYSWNRGKIQKIHFPLVFCSRFNTHKQHFPLTMQGKQYLGENQFS